jgi:ubiquinone/menaquinone biosynthesis C-methylase UbiE
MIPVENGFFNSILVACAIEHFENDSDMKFVKEASRILKSHGKILILPLYLHNNPFYVTDPTFSVPGNVNFSENLNIHCIKNWGNRQGRFYSPQTLHNRLIEKNSNNIEFKVIYIKNFNKIDPSIYCRFALLGTKK